jgi:hypothetical protein
MAIALVNKRKLEKLFPRKSFNENQINYEEVRKEFKSAD